MLRSCTLRACQPVPPAATCRHRQRHRELRSFARRGADRDLAPVLLHDAMRHGQPQAGAVLVLLGGEERIENARQHVCRDAASRVLHPHRAPAPRRRRSSVATSSTSALGHGLRGVHHQHQHHLLDLVGVALHRRQALAPVAPPARCSACPACASPAARRGCTMVFRSLGSRWLGACREKVSRFFTRSPQRLLSRSMVCSCSASSSRSGELVLQQLRAAPAARRSECRTADC